MKIDRYARTTYDKKGFALILIPSIVFQYENYSYKKHYGLWFHWLVFDLGIEISK